MAKKKRGRPPGSKNKKSIGNSVATMDVSQLRAHIDSLQSVLAKKINEQRAYFEDQLSQLDGNVGKDLSGGQGRHAAQTYEGQAKVSKQEKQSLKWSGRG